MIMKNHFLLLICLVALTCGLPPISPTNCVQNCTCKDVLPNILNIVECKGPLTINSTLFSHLDRRIITVMTFSNVIIDQIKDDAFKRIPNLEDVVIAQAQIGSIDSKAFNNVKKVKFADCGFEDSPNFSSEKLEELHFGNCKLDVIPALDNLFSLKFLNLSGNYIRNIDITSFAEVFDLESLILSNNQISRIPANIFVNNEELNSLYLDNNPLKTFYLNTSNKLETLSLKNCFLSTFDERSSQRLTSLSELNLANNRIQSLQAKDLAAMEQLTVIDLSNNSLRKLDNDIFIGNPNLQKVTLDGNKFEMLPYFTLSKEDKFKIYTFSCKNCGLTSLSPKTFKNMPAVISLNLAYNNFTYIQDMLKHIVSLRMLDISYNNLQSLKNTFDNNKNLELLNVAGNPLIALNPNNFIENKAIKKIDASYCKLRMIWSNNSTVLSSLRKLLLAGNDLIILSIQDFKIVPGLKALDLHDNPLVFNEDVCQAINYLESHYVDPIESDKLKGPLSDDIDNFLPHGWAEFHQKRCPDTPLSENEDTEDEELEDDKDNLEVLKTFNDNKDDDEYDDADYDSNYNDSYDDDEDEESERNDDVNEPSMGEEVKINLTRVSYILSITSVFVLTALAVLIVAVVITLCVLRRNNRFNMTRANLPRLKIPLWDHQFSEKKHSGSVYRPLSEDLSGPKTPKMSRYEFSAAPTVHTTIP